MPVISRWRAAISQKEGEPLDTKRLERDLVTISEALTGLATFDVRMSQVVELRFFGGLTVEETADVLKVSPETVMRDWKTAKAWLLREIRRGDLTA